MASRRDALRSLLRGARSVSFAGTHHPAAASYATTSGWYERNARGGTWALDRASREERALNDLLVQSGHHERVLALVQNGVVSHDVSPGVPDATARVRRPSVVHLRNRRETAKTSGARVSRRQRGDGVLAAPLGACRVPLGGPVNRRRWRRMSCATTRGTRRCGRCCATRSRASARSNWRPPSRRSLTSTPSPGTPRARAARVSPRHARKARHRARCFIRAVHENARARMRHEAHRAFSRRRARARARRRSTADDDGWRAVSDAVSRAAVSRRPSSRRTRSDTRGLFACLAWNLHYGDSWRSANRLKRAREPWRARARVRRTGSGARWRRKSSSARV